jgi:hypothetical protein
MNRQVKEGNNGQAAQEARGQTQPKKKADAKESERERVRKIEREREKERERESVRDERGVHSYNSCACSKKASSSRT